MTGRPIEPDDPVGSALAVMPADLAGLSDEAIQSFTTDRDDLLGRTPPESLLPDSEEAFYARDPFSADYADFLKDRGGPRAGGPRIDAGLRADLLARPHLMTHPEEAAHRGAAAVWRSLRAQLHNEAQGVLDRSDPAELEMLRREMDTRKRVAEGVTRGLDAVIRRVEQRLREVDGPSGQGA